MNPPVEFQALEDLIRRSLPLDGEPAWREALSEGVSEARWFALFAGAGRRWGYDPVLGGQFGLFGEWDVATLARVLMLRRRVSDLSSAPARAEFMDGLFRRGDAAEQRACLKGLSLLPEPHMYRATAVEALRTNNIDVFSSLALKNPYPAAYFEDPSFHQMVLKALFQRLNVREIKGLSKRLTAELSRMAVDYGRELTAAGREWPPGLAEIQSGRLIYQEKADATV